MRRTDQSGNKKSTLNSFIDINSRKKMKKLPLHSNNAQFAIYIRSGFDKITLNANTWYKVARTTREWEKMMNGRAAVWCHVGKKNCEPPAGSTKQIQHQMPERGRNESESHHTPSFRIGVCCTYIYVNVMHARVEAHRQTVAVAVSAP